MKLKECGRMDFLELELYAVDNPLAQGFDRVERILNIISTHDPEYAPEQILMGNAFRSYSVEAARRQLSKRPVDDYNSMTLIRKSGTEIRYEFSLNVKEVPFSFYLSIVIPFSFFTDPVRGDARSHGFVSLASALAKESKAIYGIGYSKADLSLGTDPHCSDPFAPMAVYEMYWLNIYGGEMLDSIGRKRVLSTPCCHMEELSYGGILFLTRPTPTDFATEEARIAQARALSHLRDDVTYDEALNRLKERSAIMAPVAQDFDPDIADLLELTLDLEDFARRYQKTADLNQYRPPEVGEWLPLDEAPTSDVDDTIAIINAYELNSEKLVAMLHTKVPEVMDSTPASLVAIDYHLWLYSYATAVKPGFLESDLLPAIGCYLGDVMVNHLGGRWVTRKNLYEAQVVVGNRVWLPLLRARHQMVSKQATLDYSMTQFYNVAARVKAGF